MGQTEVQDIISGLKKYSLNEIAKEWMIFFSQLNKSEAVNVVNAGLFNAGKSELYNALVDMQGCFATGAGPTTSENNVFNFGDLLCLIDTPGIEANEDDTEKAFQAYKEADIILFLHNVNIGEFHDRECKYLQQIKSCFPAENDFASRVIFLASWSDSKDGTGALNKIIARMKEQLDDIGIKSNAEILPVSAKRYLKGLSENKKSLINNSNILQLKERIISLATELKDDKIRLQQDRFNRICKETVFQLQEKQELRRQNKAKKERHVRKKEGQLFFDWSIILSKFQTEWISIYQKQKEILAEYDDVL